MQGLGFMNWCAPSDATSMHLQSAGYAGCTIMPVKGFETGMSPGLISFINDSKGEHWVNKQVPRRQATTTNELPVEQTYF